MRPFIFSGFARAALLTLMLAAVPGQARAASPCRIEVIERESGWPVPMVELRTTHNVRLVTDNAGVIACDLPELMGVETWFEVIGHGYTVPADGFGYVGKRLKPEPGATLVLKLDRKIIAKRMGRLTGAGLFAESQKLGKFLDWKESGVFGQDSVQNAVYQGKLFWTWGDTTVARYPLGVFDMTGAFTSLAPLAVLTPPLQYPFPYLTNREGQVRGIAKMPGDGPTWISGVVTLPDKNGTPRLVATYQKIRNYLEAYEAGHAVWKDQSQTFQQLKVRWKKSESSPKLPTLPEGHPVLYKDDAGKEWVAFGNPLPYLRCPATFEAWQDEAQWEKLAPQDSFTGDDGSNVKPHTGSITWSPWRKKWVTVFMQAMGKPSALGELWYAEAASPTGPWGKAVKILSHNNYTFYNPRIHPELTPQGSPALFFEGTYTTEFSDNKQPTPRYNYNQILYRLDLDDPLIAPAFKPAN